MTATIFYLVVAALMLAAALGGGAMHSRRLRDAIESSASCAVALLILAVSIAGIGGAIWCLVRLVRFAWVGT